MENIVVNIEADTTALENTIDVLEKLGQIDKKTADEFRRTNQAYAKRVQETKAAGAAATDLGKKTEDAGKKIVEANKQSDNSFTGLKKTISSIGPAIGLAFGVAALANFAKQSTALAFEFEKAELRLKTALQGRVDIQQRLIAQAGKLEKSTGVDDRAIIEQQTFLALQGRSAAQIEKTIEAAIRLSKVTGKDLATAVQELDGTFEGVVGRLGKLDERFKDFGESQLKTGAAIDLVNEKFADILTVQTDAEKATNDFNNSVEDLQRNFGTLILKLAPAIGMLGQLIDQLNQLTTSDFDLAKSINAQETKAATDAAISDFIASRNALIQSGKTFEQANTEALQQEIAIRQKLGREAFAENNYRQTLIYKAQIDGIKEAAAADLEASKGLSKAKEEENRRHLAQLEADRKKAQEKADKEREEQQKIFVQKIEPIDATQQPVNVPVKIQIEAPDETILTGEQKAKIIEGIMEQIEDTLFDFAATAPFDFIQAGIENSINAIEEALEMQQEALDNSLAANKKRREDDIISEREFLAEQRRLNREKEKAEADAQKKINDQKRKEDVANRLRKLFEIGIATARNITEHPFAAPYYIALGAIQAGIVLATPLPKYKKGTLSVPGQGSEDTVAAMLTPGEAVMPKETTKRYHPALKAIYDGAVPAVEINDFVTNKASRMHEGGVPATIAATVDNDALGASIAYHLRDHRVKIRNVSEIARAMKPEYDPRPRI